MQNTTEYKPSRRGLSVETWGIHDPDECASNPADVGSGIRAVVPLKKLELHVCRTFRPVVEGSLDSPCGNNNYARGV